MTILNQSNISYQTVYPDGQIINQSQNSNIVKTDVITYLFSKIKSTLKEVIAEGEITTQTVNLFNNSDYVLSNIVFNDNMSDGADYVEKSVFINGISFPEFDVKSGFSLPILNPNENVTIDYDIKANNPKTSILVNNFATINYTVQTPIIGPVNFIENTNVIEIGVVSKEFSLIKSVNKTSAYEGDILRFTNKITNLGTSDLKDILFKDVLNFDFNFVINSVRIDGVLQQGLNPSLGFYLTPLLSGNSHVIEFNVIVNHGILPRTISNISLLIADGKEISSNNVFIDIIPQKIDNPSTKIILTDEPCKCNCCVKRCLSNLCKVFRNKKC